MIEKPNKETIEKWRKDPNNWKFGQFYYNKEDRRVFPPKRIPWMGWTVNFANLKLILAFISIMALVIGIIIFFTQ